MTDFAGLKAEQLKAQAEAHLTKMLKHQNDLFTGTARELVVLAMSSFACETIEQELKSLFKKKSP